MYTELLETLKSITPEEREILKGRTQVDESIYNLNRSMIVDCKKLLANGQLIEMRPHTRFIHFPKHTHNYIEVVYMCSGQTRHVVNGSEILLNTGELLFMSQYATQEIFPAGEEDVAVNLIILPEFFGLVLDLIGAEPSLIRDFLVDCLRNTRHDVSYLHFKVADVLPIQNLMENLISSLLYGHYSQRLNQNTMALLFLYLMNYTDHLEIGKEHLEQEITLKVFQYIEEHYRDGELSQLAAGLHYDLYQLSRIVKSVTGSTYTELLQEKRLQKAAFLLTTTGLSVSDICMDVGYNNFSYFYRIFKEKYGVTPREYRLRNLKNG
ncbi:MAG: AraC family transcriptional regulator [Clostridiales bacterium]|nr:AraC family transcriptional regulator [Clostridiales bacterium]